MSLFLRALLPLALLAWTLASPDRMAMAQELCTPGDRDITNPDGSQLRIRRGCGEDGTPYFDFLSAARGSTKFASATPAGYPSEDAEPSMDAYFDDLDKDGYPEIITRGMCGAGPNCLGEVFRWNRKTQQLDLFLTSGWADLQFVDGYLVAAGRASCCAWEFSGYRWDSAGYGDDENRDMSVEVKTVYPDEKSDEGNLLCTFSRKTEGEWHIVPPPSPAWLKFCEIYGEKYDIEGPQDRD